MPELPEVETIKNQLRGRVKGKTIVKVKVIDYQKKVQGKTKNLLAKIKNIQRRGKLLIFELVGGYSFVIHLKLTGQLIYYSKLPEIEKKTHVIFYFKDGSGLFFNDFRKFGFVKIMKSAEVEKYLERLGLGPEPLTLGFKEFKGLLEKKKRSKIKPTLMDQKVLAGLGNIYAQEACFRAGILPERVISSLTESEIKKLYQAIKTILKSAIQHQGTSFDTTYRTVEGKEGGFEPYVKVYHRKNCPKCKTKLKIIKLGGRSTYCCEKCQT